MIQRRAGLHRTAIRHALLVLGTIAAIFVAAAPASAGTASGKPAVHRAPGVSYTVAQRQALQAEVGRHLADYGAGQQVGLNQIIWAQQKLTLTLPLPGEAKARAVTEPITPFGVANCSFLFACLWSDTNFNGSRLAKTDCGTITLAAPYNSSTASIHNNQSTGTQTTILNGSRQILNATLAPSRVNDTGVGSRGNARFWTVC